MSIQELDDLSREEDELARSEAESRIIDLRARAELEMLTTVMTTVSGRAFAWWVLDLSGIDALSYTANDNQTNFREGRRSLGIDIRDEIARIAPLLYEKMRTEASDRERHFQAQASLGNDEG